MSENRFASEHESREVAEAAREEQWKKRSFMKELFAGQLSLSLIHPHPEPKAEEQARAADFLARLEAFAEEHIDGDAHDREGWVPDSVLEGLAELGAFGIKIPTEYGGLGLSQLSYNRALALVASRCAATGAFLSAHQSIGVPTPLVLFGTEEQKERFLPRLAGGQLSAFALTEPEAGSDPGQHDHHSRCPPRTAKRYLLNGEKLWCDETGPSRRSVGGHGSYHACAGGGEVGTRPDHRLHRGSRIGQGVEVVHTCELHGVESGLSNGVLRLQERPKVPK